MNYDLFIEIYNYSYQIYKFYVEEHKYNPRNNIIIQECRKITDFLVKSQLSINSSQQNMNSSNQYMNSSNQNMNIQNADKKINNFINKKKKRT